MLLVAQAFEPVTAPIIFFLQGGTCVCPLFRADTQVRPYHTHPNGITCNGVYFDPWGDKTL
jgi:hypothetical protein